MVNIKRVASAESRSMRGASDQLTFMDSCLTISHMLQPCIPSSRCVKALCFMAPYDWANGSYVDGFLTWGVWFYLQGVDAILGNGYGTQGQSYDLLLQGSEM